MSSFLHQSTTLADSPTARQDASLRKLNAWGWKMLVRLALGVRARGVDCAFRLLRTSVLQRSPLQTRGAMINAELVSTLRRGGRGAIVRASPYAVGAVVFYACAWHRGEWHRGEWHRERTVAPPLGTLEAPARGAGRPGASP
jgi:hypothetical protein